jgi:hypothetical protein
MKHVFCSPAKARGIAVVEMVIVTPILLLLGLGVIEVSHLILAKNVTTALAREGANLASRSFADSDQEIMDALALSADPPLDLSQDGVIYISVVVGDDDPYPYISEQHRWLDYGYSSSSRMWGSCSSWDGNGACNLPSTKPRLTNFPMALEPGETVHVVEVMYDYSTLTRYVFDHNLVIYTRVLM